MTKTSGKRNPTLTRQQLIDATVLLMLRQGFHATSVNQICLEAGLTKGAFFHHFPTKELVGEAAVQWWGNMGTSLYSEAWKDDTLDPLEQVHRMFEIMESFTKRMAEPCVCMVGMMSQELSQTHPEIQQACVHELEVWTTQVATLLEKAQVTRRVRVAFDSVQVGWLLNSLWQGSMLIAKTRRQPELIRDNLRFARAYVDGLFETNNAKNQQP